ncbi:MAG: DUF4435 domain-containing protein [Bacteroidaceae bacterium]|nr:DUF4435 domain-containing protein [Bacteroidaceae bacterium]
MNHLLQNLSSQYLEAANRLRPKGSRRRVVAYVESYDDVAFWRLLLDEFESDRVTFNIMLPSNGRLARGKKSALNECLKDNALGSELIACVDSDYDYLMQGATISSREFLQSPYVLQTYTYAIENYLCYSGSLNQICVQCTLNDHRLIDFEAFFELYSRIVFPLFVWNIWFYRKRRHNEFSMQEFNTTVTIDSVDVRNPQKTLARLEQRVARKVAHIEEQVSESVPDALSEVEAMKSEFEKLGVHPGNTYMFMQGHFIFERILPRVMDPVMSVLRHERESEIYRLAVHPQQRQNELSSYRHSQIDLAEALHKNTHYRDSELYRRMRADVTRILEGK